MSNSLSQLREHLKSMFQFDNNDLDFGIFRILKLKRNEVEAFIDNDLERIVLEALGDVALKQQEHQRADLIGFVKEKGSTDEMALLDDLSGNKDALINFINYKNPSNKDTLLSVLADASTNGHADDLADRIYNHVLRFFERYYRDGDFGYNDRSLATYQVDYPAEANYDGSDILFHWKHKDSYYIKTANGFGSVPFNSDEDTRIEFRLETGVEGAVGLAQNSNKDDQQKHFALDRIEQDEDGTWQVVFHLASASTSKVEIYTRLLADVFGITDNVDKYLHKKPGTKDEPPGKPLFNDLDDKYDEVQAGQLKGMGKLRLPADKVLGFLALREEFRDLGNNKTERTEALVQDETVQRLLAFDKALNAFYVGTDSDYFVHKNLRKFLTNEQQRYIHNVILSDLDALLNFEVDKTVIVIARAFRRITDDIITFLCAVEEFQKNLFLMKKKVVETGYLISVGKITEVVTDEKAQRELLEQIVSNKAQVKEWKETFGVDPNDPVQLGLEDAEPVHALATHRTLPVDTRYFDVAFVDRLFAYFDDIEALTTGLLINSENLQALRLLESSYRGQIKCTYIDPPYNTDASEILYKNNFRHSSWLSLIENRLNQAKELLSNNGMICVTIDDFEAHRLHALIEQVFGLENIQGVVPIRNNPSGRSTGKGFSISHEYGIFAGKTDSSLIGRLPRTKKQRARYDQEDEIGFYEWVNFRKHGGKNANRSQRKRLYYPIYATWEGNVRIPEMTWNEDNEEWVADSNLEENEIVVFPTNNDDEEKTWKWGHETALKDIGDLCSRADQAGRLGIYMKSRMKHDGILPSTWWDKKYYSATSYGTSVIGAIFGDTQAFSFPKSVFAVADCLRVLNLNTGDAALDFFAGSGTTGQAVLKLNKEDNGKRRFILVEMGDYFERVLRERLRRVMYSQNWKNGKPIKNKVDGTVSMVKYQRLEQYEDVLNNLDLTGADTLPEGVPMQYLYRPAEQRVRQSMDLSKPFDCTIKYGKDNTQGTVDVMESYCYIKGFPIRQRRRYDLNNRIYRVVCSGRHLIVLRNIDMGEDDTEALQSILSDFDRIGVLHINHDVDQRKLDGLNLNIRLITQDSFDAGTTWS